MTGHGLRLETFPERIGSANSLPWDIRIYALLREEKCNAPISTREWDVLGGRHSSIDAATFTNSERGIPVSNQEGVDSNPNIRSYGG